ncbi:hypothetical protein [Pseudoalteromonas sp. H71]|uniref:hypothetical protein n=1 Tax=Pseudoalteromonas sp. H71 TaxID=1348395 RepID=UPI0007307A9A|nr:hypothetical protein [Pseudoalteromonas sp. H71]KTD88861.1 hypothetical protein ATS71_10510 [Pseudoalteromonas sp. H71]
MKYIGFISVFSLSIAFFFMAFESEYRVYAYLFLFLFVLASFLGVLSFKKNFRLVDFNYDIKLLLSVVSFLCAINIYSSYQINDYMEWFDIFRVIYVILVIVGLVISINIWGVKWYTDRLVIIISLLSVLSLFFYYLGFYLDSTNFYASMLLLPAMYLLTEKKYKYFSFILLLTLFLGIALEARGAYMGVILFLMVYYCNRLIKIPPPVMVLGIVLILTGQVLLLLKPSVIADEILSYRPTIWNYYIYEGFENLWIGGGPILTYIAEGAAAHYQSMIGRGVGTAYGTQSMYVLYFYESGIVGLCLLLFMMFTVFYTKSRYIIPFFSISVLAFMETIKIGAVSIYGLPFTYFLVLSLVTKRRK